MQLEYAYAGDILKYDKQPDGSLMVYGMATDPSQDLDGQGCDPTWLAAAMPEWFKFANIREQHSSVAAGVGKELERADGDRWMLKSHIVDANTVRKVEAGVLKGYSIGVRKGKVQRDKAAGYPNGRIVGGDIVEVSLVDRPCNPHATITIAKSAGSGQLEAVDPELIDVDPSMYDETPEGVPSGHDDDGEPDDEQGAQAVGEPDDDDDDAGAGDLSLFDDDVIEVGDDDTDDALDKALSLLDDVADEDDDEEVIVTKGLLESLIHGTKKPKAKRDGDHDGQVGEGSGDEAKKRAAAKKRREAERKRERDHHSRMDAEALQDANHAQRQGRREEADSHRGRLGSYRKALELSEYRAGVKLVKLVLDGVITKSLTPADNDAELIAELAELVVAEASQLAAYDGVAEADDVALLVDACAAIAKMAGYAPAASTTGVVVDTSTGGATLDIAEIVKAQVAEQLSEVAKAHEAGTADLRAQVTKMLATPLPGGPLIGRMALPSTPAQTETLTKAAELDRLADNPTLSPAVAAGYRARAEELRRKG